VKACWPQSADRKPETRECRKVFLNSDKGLCPVASGSTFFKDEGSYQLQRALRFGHDGVAMPKEFRQTLERVKRGDAAAFAVLVEQYGPAIRREVRFRVLDARVRRRVEESDILQSVMLRLWLGLWVGEYDIETPESLNRLLKVLTRNCVVDVVRYWTAECRDVREQRSANLSSAAGDEAFPSQIVEVSETLEALRRELPERELKILEARQAGQDWESIAQELGGDLPADSVRRQHQRVVKRLLTKLGWGG
jgi:RNA polymerase sigma factor (sigma-70 family)